MSQLPHDMVSFVRAFTDLEPWQKDFLEKVTKLRFADIEKRIASQLAQTTEPDMESVLLGIDWADGIDRTAMMVAQIRGDGVMVIFDELMGIDYKTVATHDMHIRSTPLREVSLLDDLMKMEIGHIDRFRFVESPLAEEPEEPRAGNGAHPNRKTVAAKAKLPFYHKNRRF